ncbi:zinc finger protein 609-like [Protopterus annectens]|uniref:zinc finger protein 609-like n=1 Tax=Protopterus annectens TaxID=7888 RepID=UPI001CFBE4E9|nr:zinc finger protein 609-like [Protopterus annectens]
MSLSSGASGGKGVDANPVDVYDSSEEWDIGVGNLIIDLEADLEKDQQKLDMSGSKETSLPAPNAVATLPDNIKFVTPVQVPQGKESKSKSKRSKSTKDGGKPVVTASLYVANEGASNKKDSQGRLGDSMSPNSIGTAVSSKGAEKSSKTSRSTASSKKEKESGSSKSKKDRSENIVSVIDKEAGILQPLALAPRSGQYDCVQGTDVIPTAEQLGAVAIDTGVVLTPLGIKSEPEETDGECRPVRKIRAEKVSLFRFMFSYLVIYIIYLFAFAYWESDTE